MSRTIFRWGGTAALVGALALFFALRVPGGVASLKGKHEEIRRLEKENADLAKEIADRQERIRVLKDSKSAQELEVRKRLKLQKQGETTIILEPPKK